MHAGATTPVSRLRYLPATVKLKASRRVPFVSCGEEKQRERERGCSRLGRSFAPSRQPPAATGWPSPGRNCKLASPRRSVNITRDRRTKSRNARRPFPLDRQFPSRETSRRCVWSRAVGVILVNGRNGAERRGWMTMTSRLRIDRDAACEIFRRKWVWFSCGWIKVSNIEIFG